MYTVMHLGLSYACNMNCQHCYVKRKKNNLSKKRVIELIYKMYEQGLMVLYYTYGEPLLAKDLFEVASFANSRNLIQILMTNGYLLTDQVANRIKETGISNVFISLDNSNAIDHDNNRRFEGAFNAAIKSIRLLKSKSIHVGISTAVTKHNAHQLKEIYEIGVKEGVGVISFLRARKDGTIIPLTQAAKEEYIDFVRFGICQNRVNLKFHDLELLPYFKKWKEEGIISDLIYDKYYQMSCCHANTTLCIAPDGNISNCNLVGNTIGNINEMQLNNLWKGLAENEHHVCCTAISQ